MVPQGNIFPIAWKQDWGGDSFNLQQYQLPYHGQESVCTVQALTMLGKPK